jgi:CheY-like chemotaxis protein
MQVTCTYDGREAPDILKQEAFDRVFLDIMMPYADGFELLDWIRSDPVKKNTWVALMTAMAGDLDATDRIRCGADYYVPKSVVVEDLLP